MLKKIVAEEKGFVIKEELFLDYKINEIEKLRNLMQKVGKKKSVLEVCFDKLKIPKKYLPNQLFCYEKLIKDFFMVYSARLSLNSIENNVLFSIKYCDTFCLSLKSNFNIKSEFLLR